MRSRDFCFWLQGWFELSSPEDVLSEHEVLIKKHLALVKESERELTGFPLWVSTVIEYELGALNIKKVRERLDAEFEHIDKDTPGDQNKMNNLHGSDKRC